MINARRSNPMGSSSHLTPNDVPGPIQLDQATALTLMLGPNGSVGIQASPQTSALKPDTL